MQATLLIKHRGKCAYNIPAKALRNLEEAPRVMGAHWDRWFWSSPSGGEVHPPAVRGESVHPCGKNKWVWHVATENSSMQQAKASWHCNIPAPSVRRPPQLMLWGPPVRLSGWGRPALWWRQLSASWSASKRKCRQWNSSWSWSALESSRLGATYLKGKP